MNFLPAGRVLEMIDPALGPLVEGNVVVISKAESELFATLTPDEKRLYLAESSGAVQ